MFPCVKLTVRARVFVAIVLALAFALVVRLAADVLLPARMAPEDYKILSAVLRDDFLHNSRVTGAVVHEDTDFGDPSGDASSIRALIGKMPLEEYVGRTDPKHVARVRSQFESFRKDLLPETGDRLLSANRKRGRLDAAFDQDVTATLISRSQYLELREENGSGFWQSFRRKYPRSMLVTFSRVGYDRKRSQALVCGSATTGGLSGEGVVFFLKKADDGWHVAARYRIWIS